MTIAVFTSPSERARSCVTSASSLPVAAATIRRVRSTSFAEVGFRSTIRFS